MDNGRTLVFLAFLSIFVGMVFGYPLENGYIHTFLGPVLTPAHAHPHHMAHSTALMLMFLSIGVAAAGIFVSYLFYVKNFPALPEKTVKTFKPIHKFLLNKWYFDELYDFLFVHPIVMLSNILWRAFDVNVVDFTVNAFGRVPMWLSGVVRHVQTGRMQDLSRWL